MTPLLALLGIALLRDAPCVPAAGSVTLAAGTRLRERPDVAALSRALLDADLTLPLLSRCGEWVEVRYDALRLFALPGDEAGPASLRPGLEATTPGLPARRERVLAVLGPSRGTLGPWALHTDVKDSRLVAFLDRAAKGATEAFRIRTGIEPPAPRDEAVALVGGADKYRALSEGPENAGHAGNGIAVVRASGSAASIREVLLHELGHLLSQRTFRGGLPHWLEEGLAEASSGRTKPLLPEEPDLDALFAARREEFTTRPELNYPLAGAVARFLLEAPRGRPFRALLASTADRGAPVETRDILTSWGRNEPEARRELLGWLRREERRLRFLPPRG